MVFDGYRDSVTFGPMSESIEIQTLGAQLDADVDIPGSKSQTNRALVMAALADGLTRVENALDSEDTRMMVRSLRSMGFGIERSNGAELRVAGEGGRIPTGSAELHVGNSGTTARFLTALAGLAHGSYTIDGVARMRQRPIQDLVDGLRPLGVDVVSASGNGCPPVTVRGAGLTGGLTRMRGGWSSQYFTAILLVAPYAETDVIIEVEGPLVSQPYIRMTIEMMAGAGVQVQNDDYRRFRIAAGQRYRSGVIKVEPDASNASYFLAAAALVGGRVRVNGLGRGSLQGDIGFLDVLAQMGCAVSKQDTHVEVVGPGALRGIDIDLNGMPDMAQTLCALAPFAEGPVIIRNVANLRIKETDRLAALAAEMGKLGVRTEVRKDGITVYPGVEQLRGAEVETYGDHRMAMSMSLIGMRVPGVVIRDPGCVNKTFEGYFAALESLTSQRAPVD